MESREAIDGDWNKLWLIFQRRWLPAVGVFSSVIGLSGVVASLPSPEYEVEGKLLFKINQTSSLTGLDQQIGDLETLTTKSNPLNQIRFVENYPMVETLKKQRDALHTLFQERIIEAVGSQRQVSNRDLQTGELKQQLLAALVTSEKEQAT